MPKGVSFIAGGNNSGKSSILQAIAIWEFCRTIIQAEKGRVYFTSGYMHQGLGIGYDEFSPINVPTLKHLWTNLSPQSSYTQKIKCSWIKDDHPKELEFGLSLANDRLFIKTTASNLAADDPLPKIAYLPPVAGISDHESPVTLAIRRRRIGEGLAGAVLRNILLDLQTKNVEKRSELKQGKIKISDADLNTLRNTDPWELLQQALRTTFATELVVAPFRAEYHTYINIEISKGNLSGHRLLRHSGYHNRDLMVEGSGFLQWLSVYALATDPDVNVLLLDEPDAHLHCSLQQSLINELKKITERTGKQVLIATHSAEILRKADPDKILEIRMHGHPRYLSAEHQKVGLLVGLGTDYAPRIDTIKQKKHILLLEGDFDYKVLRKCANKLGLAWTDKWVEWVDKSGNKERKHIFRALAEEIDPLVAISIRDRDDEPVLSVGEQLEDKTCGGCPPRFYPRMWRRRNIESYLIWPEAIALAKGVTLQSITDILRDNHAVTVGDTFADAIPPEGLLTVDGKKILEGIGVDALSVLEHIPADKIAEDIKIILAELTSSSTS